MMDTVLKLYYFDGQQDMAFPYGMEQAELHDFTVSKTRMGNAPTITGTLEYPVCLDDEWGRWSRFDDVYVVFNGERYYLKATPTSSKSNDKLFYKHDLNFVSERVVLETTYMVDDNENQTANILYSNNTQYTFFGDINAWAERINQSMYFSGVGDTCMYQNGEIVDIGYRVLNGDGFYIVVDSGVTVTDEFLVTLSNSTVAEALKQTFEKFGVPYYFVGRVIHFGDYEPAVESVPAYADNDGVLGAGLENGTLVPYEYGHPNSVLQVSRNNGTKEIYNRCSGTGSSDNIPYYYPNPTPSGTIHHQTTAQSGSTLTDNAVTVTDPLKFSNLGDGDALVFSFASSASDSHIFVNGVYIDGRPMPKGGAFVVDFPYDDGAGEYYGIDKQIMVEFSLTQVYELVGLNFVSEFQENTNWEVIRPDGVIMRGIGRFASLSKPRFINENDEFVFGVYKLNLTKTYEPSNALQAQEWFDLDDLWGDIEAGSGTPQDPYLWFGSVTQGTYGWKLQSTNNMVYLNDYGLSIAHGITLRQGDKIEKVIDKWVMPQEKLMPSCYRESDGKKRFYPARNYPFATSEGYDSDLGDEVNGNNVDNDFYKDDNDNYYEFANPYRRLKQREHIYDFPDIKPSIKGMTNVSGYRIDMFVAFDYDLNDDNSGYYDENGNFKYNHPYFFGLLRPTSTFNLFAQAIDEAEMTIAMTSGHCAPCEFKVMVDEETQKNLVQVGVDMFLERDEEGDVICGRKYGVAPQDAQQDTTNNYVWIALEKDISTFGGDNIMPYNKDGVTIRPNACTDLNSNNGDTFVILHIDMPQAYIEAAEEQLTKEIVKRMNDDNSEKFNKQLKYSRVYLGDNQDLIALLNENVKVYVRYNGVSKQCFVSSYSYAMRSTSPIPEITVGGLVETVEELKSVAAAGKSFMQKVGESVSENFAELMLGFNKPFTRIINQNNTQVTNQIKGEFPTDYVATDAELFAQNLIVGAGGKRVRYFKNGVNGQVLTMKDGKIVWGDSGLVGETTFLQSAVVIPDSATEIGDFRASLDAGVYLVNVTIDVVQTSDLGTRASGLFTVFVNYNKADVCSAQAFINGCGQLTMTAVFEVIEGESTVKTYVYSESSVTNKFSVVSTVTNNSTPHIKPSMISFVKIS